MQQGDWLVYYSPSTEMGGGRPLRAFTAIGRIAAEGLYTCDMGNGFVPNRRDVAYLPIVREVPIDDIAAQLRFVRDNPNWGLLARRGHFEIDLEDLSVIAAALGAAG
jgi:hypothetical protein